MPRGIDRFDPGDAKIPFQVRLDERGNKGSARSIHMDRNIPRFFLLFELTILEYYTYQEIRMYPLNAAFLDTV